MRQRNKTEKTKLTMVGLAQGEVGNWNSLIPGALFLHGPAWYIPVSAEHRGKYSTSWGGVPHAGAECRVSFVVLEEIPGGADMKYSEPERGGKEMLT